MPEDKAARARLTVVEKDVVDGKVERAVVIERLDAHIVACVRSSRINMGLLLAVLGTILSGIALRFLGVPL